MSQSILKCISAALLILPAGFSDQADNQAASAYAAPIPAIETHKVRPERCGSRALLPKTVRKSPRSSTA